MKGIEVAAVLKHITTNPMYCTDEIEVAYHGVRVRVGRQTGNWHPDAKVWLASIHADIYHYADEEQYAFGLAGWGALRDEAIVNAFEFAKNNTLQFPPGWLTEVMIAIEAETTL